MADLTAQNKWEPLATDNSDREKIWSKSRTFAGDVWFRFRRKPTAIAGFVIIIALMLFALVGPLFTPYDYSVQNLEVVNVPPAMKVYQIPNGDYLYITTALKVISVTPDGKLSGQLRKVRETAAVYLSIHLAWKFQRRYSCWHLVLIMCVLFFCLQIAARFIYTPFRI